MSNLFSWHVSAFGTAVNTSQAFSQRSLHVLAGERHYLIHAVYKTPLTNVHLSFIAQIALQSNADRLSNN